MAVMIVTAVVMAVMIVTAVVMAVMIVTDCCGDGYDGCD